MEKSFDFGVLLKNHAKKHKIKPTQFVSVAGGVQKRLENNIKYRKSSRLTIFDSIRNLSRCESPVPMSDAQSKVEYRRLQLEKWKEEKEKQKKAAAARKKKPFIAGVPHLPLKFVPPPPPPKPVPSTSGRVTRSQYARNNVIKQKFDVIDIKTSATQSFAPKNASFRPPQMKNTMKVPSLVPVKSKKEKKVNTITFDPVLPALNEIKQTRSKSNINKHAAIDTKVTRKQIETKMTKGKSTKTTKQPIIKKNLQSSSSSSEVETIKSPISKNISSRKSVSNSNSLILMSKSQRKSVPKEIKEFTPSKPIPKSESSSEEKLRSQKSPVNVPMTPEEIVEEAMKCSPCVTMSRGKDNARKEMKKKMEEGLLDEDASNMDSVDHFKRQLASEIKRMTDMCEVWDRILEQTVLPEAVQECVLGAVGQARLLMSQKLQQFASLLQRCARPSPGQALVTCADLHGFWDMVFMQVENVDMRFKRLEELRARGWVDEQPVEVKRKAAKLNMKKATKPAGVPSRLREMIAAARKAKKEQEVTSAPSAISASPDNKTFEAGFFCVRSPVRSPAALVTPNKTSLLKAVLSSEAKKASASKNSASFAMLRASVLGKNVECDGIAPLPQTPMTPINLYATPARSILKQTKVETGKKSGKKSIKVVLFDQSDTELPDNTSMDNYTVFVRNKTEEQNSKEVDLNIDSGLSSMDIEKEPEHKNKENSKRKSKLVRQDATEDRSPVMTRSRRKSAQTPGVNDDEKTPRRSGRRTKVLHELESNIDEEKNQEEGEPKRTSKRSTRRRKSSVLQSVMQD